MACASRSPPWRWTRQSARRVDTLNFQIRELERAQLRAGEDEELDQRRTLLRSAGKLMDALQVRSTPCAEMTRAGESVPCWLTQRESWTVCLSSAQP